MEKMVEALGQDLETLAQVSPEPASGGGNFAEFYEQCQALSYSNNQIDLLNVLIESASKFAPRVALFILKEDTLHGWAARGFSHAFNEGKVKKVHLRVNQFPELNRSILQEESFVINFSDLSHIADIIKDFDGFVPFLSAFYPIEVRGKVAALLYADSGSESGLNETTQLALLAYVAGLELTQITAKIKKQKEVKTREVERSKPSPPPDPTFDTGDFHHDEPTKPEPPPSPTPPSSAASDDSPEIQKAKRVARVLVSDLKLYHEREVAAAQVKGNLYDAIREDIDRSYQHYKERAGTLAPPGTNYFKDELLRQLAEGNPRVLGNLPF
ncbi:MAG: hypothetical protein H6510_05435 [Acidobacteria bacterium]|nr:hypothetical protein [Acidobacteriota bacterium]